EHIDSTIIPGNDFFDYANGNWFKHNPIPPTESSWGIGHLVQNEINDQLRKINEDAASNVNNKQGSTMQKIGDFWRSGMDSTKIEKLGISPLQPELQKIHQIKDIPSLLNEIAYLKTIGVETTFDSYVAQDDKNSAKMVFRLDQGGIGLPNRDFYLKPDPSMQKIRSEYASHIAKMLTLTGDDSVYANKESQNVMQLETSLARVSRSLADLRDPYSNYHKMTLNKMDQLTPYIQWNDFIQQMDIHSIDSVVVGQPEFYQALNKLLKSTPLDTWKSYLKYHLITSFASALSSNIDNENFHFYGTILSGQLEQQPRWKRVLRMEQRVMGELLGQLFVKNYFPEKTKERYSQLVDRMMAAFKTHIEDLDWMSDSTKKYALYKLSKITKKVGYPDKWKDFSSLRISPDSLVANLMHGNEWWYQYNINKLGKPVDRSEWDMTPQTYNAYYNPSNNEIVLPAAIFTVPGVPDSLLDDAIIYGYAGASTIGHELTHGFDDQGRLYDAEGNLHNWWTKEDAKKFDQRTALLVKQFNSYIPVDSFHINGQATLGENLADLGGLVIGITAFQKTKEYKEGKSINGFTPMQRYFLGYALGWLIETRKQSLLRQVLSDVHSPAKYRVNGPMTDIPQFHKAFNVKPGNALWRPDSLRVKVW
ncbi:MAG: M13 family metallopeptidase, partial [Chitinophagaceae bacterium]